jgi:predicted cupin superfamily sugar epimerase
VSPTLAAKDLIRALGLEPLEGEGGYFRRTWTSPVSVADPVGSAPAQAGSASLRRGPAIERTSAAAGRACGSAIYYLLTADREGFSAFHRLATDEIYHFYRGDPVELHLFKEDGSYERLLLGPAFERGQLPQAIVPARAVQGSRLAPGGSWALLGTTMAPAFAPEDFALVGRAELGARYPEHAALIDELTRI